MTFSAVIFDMDGLLLDTEIIALQTFEATCKVLQLEVNRAAYFQCLGTNSSKTREILQQAHGPGFPYETVEALWAEAYKKEALDKPVPLKAGANWLLDTIKVMGIPMAVATSTDYQKAVKKLKHAEIFHYFNGIVAGDQVEKSKPDPEIYLKAAAILEVEPACCLALEDSDNGIKAALAAGMTAVQVPDLIKPSTEAIALGHTIVTNLFEIAPLLNQNAMKP